MIDPLGLALENFDVTGKWRIKDNGVAGGCHRRAVRRHDDRRPGRLARGAAQAPGRRPPELHREPDDLRARPPRRSRTTCRRCARSSATRPATTTGCRRSSWASSTAPRSVHGRATGRDDAASNASAQETPCMFIDARSTLIAARVLKGHGRHGRAAVARSDGAGRRGARKRAARREAAPGRDRDGARLRRQHRVRPAEEPVVAGRGRARRSI